MKNRSKNRKSIYSGRPRLLLMILLVVFCLASVTLTSCSVSGFAGGTSSNSSADTSKDSAKTAARNSLKPSSKKAGSFAKKTTTADTESESKSSKSKASNSSKSDTSAESQSQPQEDTGNRVSLVAVGDDLIHDSVLDTADAAAGSMGDSQYDFRPIYQNVKEDIEGADLSFINQETIIGGGRKGYPCFNSPDALLDALGDTGFDVVNGATNHSMDAGVQSIRHEIELFRNSPMTLLGLYENASERNTIPVVERNGVKIAFLTYAYGLNSSRERTHVSLFDEKRLTDQVNQAKTMADFVVVSAHWGVEYQDSTNSMQEKYAKLMTDLGVDLVVGTHPHCIQPACWYTNASGHRTLVLYSLGNFVSGQKKEKSMYEGMFKCSFVIKDGQKSIEDARWIPLIDYYQAQQKNAKELYNFSNVQVCKASQFTAELSRTHGLTGFQNMEVSRDRCLAHTRQIITEIPIEDN
jgi:poly-gamma-glutamate capsule biosynthesis protein CapA/YwtB (metallophosphatase superfamily)